MTTVKRILVGVVLGAGLGALPTACTSVPHGPTYTDAELQAICEREGGWWRGGLVSGYCESAGTTMP